MTTYINKEIAEKVAKQLLKDAYEKIKKIKEERDNLCVSIYNGKIEPDVFSKLNDLPSKWVHKTNGINFRSETGQYHYYSGSTSVFESSDGRYCNVTQKEYESIRDINKKIESLIEKTEVLRVQIVSQLLKFRSYSKIEKEFPEAFVFLPKEQIGKNLPAINIKEILTSIKKL